MLLSIQLLPAQQWQQNLKIVEPTRTASSAFGLSIATYDNYAAFGASSVDVGLTINAGKVHIAKKECEGWFIYQEITLFETEDYCGFGSTLEMYESTLVVSGCDPLNPRGGNALYIYERGTNNLYTLTQKIAKPEDTLWDNFSSRIAISGDFMVVGASYNSTDSSLTNILTNAGAAYIYFRDASGVWSLVQKITASDRGARDNFGNSVAIYENTIVVGTENEGDNWAGAAYVFEKNTNSNFWNQVAKLVAYDFRGLQDRFGGIVKINKDIIAISAARDDDYDSILSGDGGGPLTSLGSVYIFKKNISGNWEGVQKIRASNGSLSHLYFGDRLDLHDDKIAVRGVEYEYDIDGNLKGSYGNIYMFNKAVDGKWNQYQIIEQNIKYNSDAFGRGIALYGEDLFVGAYWHDYDNNEQNFLNDSGAIYLFNTYDDLKKTEINSIPVLTACENLGSGFSSAFDMSTLEHDLVDKPEDYIFYYKDYLGNDLPSPLPEFYTNTLPYTEEIFVRVENKYNSNCYETSQIKLQTLSSFDLNVIPDLYECDDTGNGFSVFDLSELDSSLVDDPTSYEFSYFDDYGNDISDLINESYQNSIENHEQITARVTNKNSLCVKEIKINLKVSSVVAHSVPPLLSCTINNSNFVAFDTSNIEKQLLEAQTNRVVYYYDEDNSSLPTPLPNPYMLEFGTVKNIRVRVEDSVLGCFAENTIVFSSENCDVEIEEELPTLKIPRFFTPNGDGVNDVWQIMQESKKNYTVYIFDRYGKLIKNLGSTNSWDGNLNGNPLPSSDYWYKIVFSNGTYMSGHFSLKR